eukprot:9299160-Ditylum_brightwellii.AAC.1
MEEIDKEKTQIMEEAEDSLPGFPQYWWSDTLFHAYQVAEYWKAALLFERSRIKDMIVLEERIGNIDPIVDMYQGDKNRKTTGQLKKHKRT